jgi:hypothetical protein
VTDPLKPAEELEDVDIDRLVPPKIMRLAQHFHNLIYIRYFYESLGQQPPEWTKAEMGRADVALQAELIREHGQGGRLRETEDETRPSEQRRERVLEAGTQFKRRL